MAAQGEAEITNPYINSTASRSVTDYSIGSSDNPVTVKEYVYFLNASRDAIEDGSWRVVWCEYYYDHYLMESSDAVIQRSGKRGAYHYSVKEGCEEQVIASLEGYVARNHFNQWRKSPLITELLHYINDQIIIETEQQKHPEIGY